jgi:hypothetical protein
MKKTTYILFGVLVFLALALSACNLPATKPTGSSQDIIMTAAVQTVEAQLTQASPGSQATQPVFGQTATSQPGQASQTPLPPAATATAEPATEVPATAAPTVAPTVLPAAAPCNRAQFVKDLTYPDGSDVATGASFTKSWRLKNTGSCTWDSNYSLVFTGKNAMGGPSSQQLTSGSVEPGDTIDVSVVLKAPSTAGSYEGDWKLSDGEDNVFGIGSGGQDFFWVKIDAIQSSRVSMAAGRTAVSVDGHVAKKGRTTFLVGARAGQIMMVSIDTQNKPLYLEITAPDGTVLLSASDQENTWQGTLPEDGDNEITVVTTGSATDFSMTITIPVRITFQSGAVSASATGKVGSGETLSYLLRASKGQTMTVKITSPDDDIFVNIFGLKDGKTYVTSDDELTTGSFTLPSTQDYVVQAVSTGSVSENITINFKVK